MPNYLDSLKTVLDDKPEAYITFLKEYSTEKKVVYGFVEGKDDPCFYKGFIDNILPSEWHVKLYPAGNKKHVLKIYSCIDWNQYDKQRVTFYVDRDHSSIVPEHIIIDTNIYITDQYSIENYLVNEYMCERILREFFDLNHATRNELDAVLALFSEQLYEFYILIIPIIATIIRWRQFQKNKYPQIRMNLNNLKLSKIFSFDKGKLVQNNYLEEDKLVAYLHSSCGVYPFGNFTISRLNNYLLNNKRYDLIRGKYLIWFIIEFCLSIYNSWKTFFPSLASAPTTHLTISQTNGLALISGKARIPPTLKQFIYDNYMNYISRILAENTD